MPYMSTRTTKTGCKEHICFLCEQNTTGRPKIQRDKETSEKTLIYSRCLQKTGRGIPHPCINSKRKSSQSISSTIQINPSTSGEKKFISSDTLDQIRSQAGLTLNQTKIVTGGIRASLGLGFFSEQTGETIHSKFEQVYQKYSFR